MRTVRACFKIYTYALNDDELEMLISLIGVEPGIKEDCLYYGLKRVSTEEDDFQLCLFLNEVLSLLLDKIEILTELKNKYSLNYVLDVKFSDIEEEIIQKTSFHLDDNISDFLKRTDTYYNLNDDYFN
ncbi:MAG: hypothetical protein ACI35W_01015 [Anaeroplasmataceae bacterium]